MSRGSSGGAQRARGAPKAHGGTYRRMNWSAYNTVGGQEKRGAWYELREAALRRCGGQCQSPGCSSKAQEVHHIVPLSRGGRNILSNLMCLCKTCHDRRHTHLRGRSH
ncbi:MAG: HNH endonuclease [Pseudomonadales bacterium]